MSKTIVDDPSGVWDTVDELVSKLRTRDISQNGVAKVVMEIAQSLSADAPQETLLRALYVANLNLPEDQTIPGNQLATRYSQIVEADQRLQHELHENGLF